jgi:teichuronic acid biosynthesis glycosyltransferase TuaC
MINSSNSNKIKILTICREIPRNNDIHNIPVAEFIFEQNNALNKLGVEFEYYLIKNGGIKGYFFHALDFLKFLKRKKYNFDIIHAHGGHIGSLANLQRRIPVVTTYHGSDINFIRNRIVSLTGLILSKKNIFVSSNLLRKVHVYASGRVIPCGIDFDVFKPFNQISCRKELKFDLNKQIILFGGARDNVVKNYKLAKKVAENARIDTMIELKGFNREEVVKVINACSCLLLTSLSEGSPMIIKEALACNCPIVSVDVGDVKEITQGIDGTFVSDFNIDKLTTNVLEAIHKRNIDSRSKIKFLDNKVITKAIFNIYLEIKSN